MIVPIHGRTLLTDSGLFTYEAGEPHDYFFGTRAHNTVVVDGEDQEPGAAHPGLFLAKDGWSYQSGHHDLYSGLRHRRGVALLGADLAIVLDRVEPSDPDDASPPQHRFEQAWHLFPEAECEAEGTSITVRSAGEPAPAVAIRQLLAEGCEVQSVRGQADPYRGWYASEYEKDVPAWEVTCAQAGPRAEWATLIATGPLAAAVPTATVTRAAGTWTVTVQHADNTTETLLVAGLADPGETVTRTTR